MRRGWSVVCVVAVLLGLTGCFQFDPPSDPTLFTEQLFNGSSIPGWYTGTDGPKEAWHADSAYHVRVSESSSLYWANYSVAGKIGDFQLDVDVTQVEGPDDNGFGIVFRNVCYNNYYYFLISGDGFMTFRKVVDGQRTDIQPWVACPVVVQGNNTNHLTIVADGSHFAFYVNGTEVLQATDSSLDFGHFGVMVRTLNEPGVHIAFDNLIVHWLGEPPTEIESVTDSFSSDSENWKPSDTEDERVWVESGEYHMLVKKAVGVSLELYQGAPSVFGSFSLLFDARVVSGSVENPFGVIFRYGRVNGKAAYYRFLMLDDGRVKLEKRMNDTTTVLSDWQECPWVAQGDVHHIHVKADCKWLRISIDGRWTIDVKDGSLARGRIGLLGIGLDHGTGFHVAMDNVKLLYYPGE